MSISREVNRDNSFLATDMANQIISNLLQGIPKRMWLPQSISSDVGGELREIGGGGLGSSQEISGESFNFHEGAPKIPQILESVEKSTSQNSFLCKFRIPIKDQPSQSTKSKNPRKDENKEGSNKDSMGKERVPGAVSTQTRLEVIPQSSPSNPSTKCADSNKDLSFWELLKQNISSEKKGNDDEDFF
ncbi:hypothetical protein U1Q18_004444 [Sarracenia purpurea var. burkii]